MDDKVLDYGDALLRVRDVALLTGRHWLNDALLSFYFEWLRRERADRPGVALVDASVGFLVANATPDVAAEVLGASRVDRAELVLFQVNDNTDVRRADGGTHWSLLAFRRGRFSSDGRGGGDRFEHFDSSPAVSNRAAADALARSAAPSLGAAAVEAANAVRHDPPDAPKQTNGWDCGVYALAVARALVEDFDRSNAASAGAGADAGAARLRDALRGIDPARAAAFRGEMLRLVESLAEGGERGGG